MNLTPDRPLFAIRGNRGHVHRVPQVEMWWTTSGKRYISYPLVCGGLAGLDADITTISPADRPKCKDCHDPRRIPIKQAAQSAVAAALRKGELVRPGSCSECGVIPRPKRHDREHARIVAHHDDYTKPLEVRWICRSCHIIWHQSNDATFGLESEQVPA